MSRVIRCVVYDLLATGRRRWCGTREPSWIFFISQSFCDAPESDDDVMVSPECCADICFSV